MFSGSIKGQSESLRWFAHVDMIDLPGRRKRERAQKRLMDVVKRVGVTEGDPGTW